MKSPCHAVARKFKSSELTFKDAKLTCHVVAQNFSLYKDTSTERYTLPDHIFQSKVLTPSFCEKFSPILVIGLPR